MGLQIPLTNEELQLNCLQTLFDKEFEHIPCLVSFNSSDSRLAIRRSAISMISQAKSSCNLDPFLVYLSVNYIDRFLSKRDIWVKKFQDIWEKESWISHILVVASLSLAAKMRNYETSILLSDLTRKEGFKFYAQSIHRMETIVLATLEWRTSSITPFSFLDYFVSQLKIEDYSLIRPLKLLASDIIFNVQQELKLLEHKPSTIAASAILNAIQDLIPQKFSSSKTAFSLYEYLNKDTLLECLGVMQDMEREGGTCNLSPTGVLDRQCTSSRSDDFVSNSEFSERDDTKRRKLNGLCGNRKSQFSEIQQC